MENGFDWKEHARNFQAEQNQRNADRSKERNRRRWHDQFVKMGASWRRYMAIHINKEVV